MKPYQKIEEMVEDILRNYPETRNSDKKLLLKAWELGGLHLTEKQKAIFMRLPSPESYRRSRQKIQARGKWGPAPWVKQKRLLNQNKYDQAGKTK